VNKVKRYNHLNLYEREIIRVGIELGKSNRVIAKKLGRSHATVSREIKRNVMRYGPDKGKYVACKAEVKAKRREKVQRTKAPLKCLEIFLYVREKLRKKWSPETIAGRLSVDMPGYSIHHETIYRYIYSKPVKNRYKLWEYLRLSRSKRRQKNGRQVHKYQGRIKDAVSIDFRPDEANQRISIGHWETDNMEGVKTDKKALSITVDRKVRYSLLGLLLNQTARQKTDAMVEGLSNYPVETVTFDNGKENSYHQEICEQLKAQTFFCHAYHSWEKGSVENMIGRIRMYLPKRQSLQHLTPERVVWIQDQLNHTPRKCLNWKTPHEALMLELQKR